MLLHTTAQEKIAELRKRIRIVRGGTSASKTFSIIPFLIEYAWGNKNSVISIVAETIPHLRRGALRDFLKIMQMVDNFNPEAFNKSNLTYTFFNGSFIEFFSADSPAKLRGARRDVLFINECNNVDFESYQQLSIRTRDCIYLDYNPTHEFWVDTELIGGSDTELITLTYKDNEALDPAIVKEIEKAREKAKTSTYWANWWRVYGLGELGVVDGLVYPDYKLIDTIPQFAEYIGTGLDFGFTNDPTSMVDIYRYEGSIIVDEVLYSTGLHNDEIAREIKKKQRYVAADRSRPDSISDISRRGVTIKATQGRAEINAGIDLVNSRGLMITKSSVNLIKEIRGYCYEKTKEGKTINKPVGIDHALDAMRYGITTFAAPNSEVKRRVSTVSKYKKAW